MTLHIALLRAINVGGRTKVAMADLRGMFAGLGYSNARTLLQTGNVVFRTEGPSGPQLEVLLERTAAERLGMATDIFVRTAEEWAAVIASNPFADAAADDPSHVVVLALKSTPDDRSVDVLRSRIQGPELVGAVGRQLYAVYPNGIGRSKLTSTAIEKHLGTRCTGRNWNTVLKLAELAHSIGAETNA